MKNISKPNYYSIFTINNCNTLEEKGVTLRCYFCKY